MSDHEEREEDGRRERAEDRARRRFQPEEKEERRIRWKRLNPWARYVEYARRRVGCTDPQAWYPFYGAKGIKCHLDAKQLEEIWTRDEAWKLKRPSLDRRDPRYDYANWNVRFIEFNLNSRLAWDKNAQGEAVEPIPEFT
jgi:hypothetical protein